MWSLQEDSMANRLITDTAGMFSCEVEVHGAVLREALEHQRAEELLRCAVIVALSALAQDAPWPDRALESMADFMVEMRERILGGDLS
jgi:hypothetical protein